MQKIIFVVLFISFFSQSQELEQQLKTFEAKRDSVQEQRSQLPKELNNNVYKKYIDNLTVDVHQPEIKNIIGNTAKIDVIVDYSLPFQIAKDIRATISKYLATSIYDYDGSFNYTFDDACYKSSTCDKKPFSPLSPDAWDVLSNQSLCLQLSFLDQNNISILIGEKVPLYGDVSVNGSLTYHFDVDTRLIKGNPQASYKYGLCRWKWQFDRVSYDLAQEIKK